MKKQRPHQSGTFSLRLVLGLALCSLGVSLALFASAAPSHPQVKSGKTPPASEAPSPASGTLSLGTPTLNYTGGGPFVVANTTAQAGPPLCTGPMFCDDYTLTVSVPAGTSATKFVKVTIEWPISAADFDVYVYQGATLITDAASSSDPEILFLPAEPAAPYTIRVIPFAPAGQNYTGKIELLDNAPPPPPPSGPVPRYKNYVPNPSTLGGSAGEPSIGVDWNPNVAALKFGTVNTGGVTFFTAGLQDLRVSFDDCSSPAKNPNPPGGIITRAPLWEDVTFPGAGTVSLDPIGFVDHQVVGEAGTGYPLPSAQLGRVFHSQLAGATSLTAFSDTDGNSWLQSQGAGAPAGVDHQTIGGGPYASFPPIPHPLYPHQIYYCSQDIGTAFCARSDDGGQTFGAGVPIWNLTQCGGLHGHVKVGPDGTVYVPNRGCGGEQGVAVSTDNGLTWTVRTVPGSAPGDTDPSVAIAADNTVYLGYQGASGRPYVATSTDKGVTWNAVEVSAGFINNTVFPAMVAGDGKRAAFGFVGTTTGGGYQVTGTFKGVWYFYIATTYDRGNTWTLVNATGTDPVQVGSICTGGTTCGADRNLLDFNDLQMDSEGRPLAAFADGCLPPSCTAATADAHAPPYNESRTERATIIRQSGGPRLLAAYDSQANCSGDPPVCPATVPKAPRVDTVTGTAGLSVNLAWSEPDNGGAALTGYKIYRRIPPAAYGAALATVTTGCPACKTTYIDTTTVTGTAYFYKVTALNAQGESTNCEEYGIGTSTGGNPCVLPGISILTDPVGDLVTPIGVATNAGWDLRELSIAEPLAFGSPDKLVFTLKVENFVGGIPPDGTRWPIQFVINGSTTAGFWVEMSTSAAFNGGTSAAPVFDYGTFNPTGGTGGIYGAPTTITGTASAGSGFTADGTITIVVPRSAVGNPPVGANLNGFLIRVRAEIPVVGAITPDNMPDSLAPSGSYPVVGNASCIMNKCPLAALDAYPVGTSSGTPATGTPPLAIHFTGATSTDPDAGDTIASYTFDFGDGSTPVTQASPTIDHTYTSNGSFNATMQVTDNHGLISCNTAIKAVDVTKPLNRVASNKLHAPAGGSSGFDIVLFDLSVHPDGTGDIECRNAGPENDYKLVYTFGSEYTVTGAASSVTITNGGTIASHGPGPGANQYTVHIAPSVPNAAHHVVTVDGMPVTNANKGNAPATIKNAGAAFDLLVGDTTNNKQVNASDIGEVKAVSGAVTNGSNFRKDVTANGVINSSDVGLTKAQSGTALP